MAATSYSFQVTGVEFAATPILADTVSWAWLSVKPLHPLTVLVVAERKAVTGVVGCSEYAMSQVHRLR